MDYTKLLQGKEYDFLRTNPHLNDNIILLGLGGSHAYGTNIETSDIDIRGIAIDKPEEIIGYQTFNQFENNETDTVIYGFNNMMKLLANANPNIIEILGLRKEDYIYISPLGQEILDNKDLFLSQKCFYTFMGYAKANLKRLENALARDNYPEEKKNEHIAISLQAAIDSFNTQHSTDINPCFAHVKDGQLVYDLDLKDFLSGDLEDLYATISNTTRNYKELLSRNRKKDDAHLNKHAMHLVRLMYMCLDILEKGEINTYRVKEHDLLMDIRNGKYMDGSGNMSEEFYQMISELTKKCEDAFKVTKLPKRVDMKALEEFTMKVNRDIINGEFKNNKFTF